MVWHDKVVWQEGMFLRAQHFQQQDRHFEHLLQARTAPLHRSSALRTAAASVTSGRLPTKSRVDGGASRPLSRLPGLLARIASLPARLALASASRSVGIWLGGT